jgi:hypothetical protein
MLQRRSALVLVAATATSLVSFPVVAANECPAIAITCSDTSRLPNPVFMAGSSAFEPVLSQLALKIGAKQGVSVIYSPISSCTGVAAVSPPAEDPTPQLLTGTAHYFVVDATDGTKAVQCSCNVAGNTAASIGVSDVAFQSCQNTAKPANVGEWFGPQQAMLIVVPEANVTTAALSSQQAAAIWGCGQQGNVSPFLDESNGTFKRSATSGTQILVARNIGVPETAFKGKATSSSSDMLTQLVGAPNPQAAIGFIAEDFYATHRSVLNAVAFRGIGQKKAYYADSDSSADDLLNVREGRYMIQGPVHLFAPLGTTGALSATARLVLDWVTGNVAIDPTDPSFYARTVASNGAVPQCAMKVQIDKDGGKFSPYTPPVSCDCAYRRSKSLKIASGTCLPCTADSSCVGGLRCQHGFCE